MLSSRKYKQQLDIDIDVLRQDNVVAETEIAHRGQPPMKRVKLQVCLETRNSAEHTEQRGSYAFTCSPLT